MSADFLPSKGKYIFIHMSITQYNNMSSPRVQVQTEFAMHIRTLSTHFLYTYLYVHTCSTALLLKTAISCILIVLLFSSPRVYFISR